MQQTQESKSILSLRDALFVSSVLLAHDEHDERRPAVEGVHASALARVGIVVLPVEARLLVLSLTTTAFKTTWAITFFTRLSRSAL